MLDDSCIQHVPSTFALNPPISISPEVVNAPKILGSKTDADKPRYDLLPASALEEVVKALTLGAKEYDPDPETQNWKKVKGWRRRYFAANQRHAWAWQRGEKLNDTGLHHLAHAIVNLMFILEKELTNQE